MNYVSYLIDMGRDYNDPKLIKKGISRGEDLLDAYKEVYNNKQLCKLNYYIANGYGNLYHLEFTKKRGWQKVLNNDNLQKVKEYSRDAIKYLKDAPIGLQKRIWTNYANCLSTLGRNMDALFAYEEVLKLDPNFSMAIANKAIAMRVFADISGNYRDAIYSETYQMLNSVKYRPDLIANGGIEAKYSVEKEIKYIESVMDKKNLSKKIEHNPYDLSKLSLFERFYIEFCSNKQLFLNFHIHEDICEASIFDPVFIRLWLPKNEESVFLKLAKPINQIKEDYAVARLLLVQSQFNTKDLDNINQRTTFANTKDNSLSNIYIGLLKSAFKEAYNILDKIARFINEYFWLGIPLNKNIYITSEKLWMDTIEKNKWIKNNKKRLKLDIIESNNASLYALYDLSLDLNFETGYYTNLRIMRNKLIHEKLIIHDNNWDDKEDYYNISYEKMLKRTIRLFKIVKSAIIHLINAVYNNEKRKQSFILNNYEFQDGSYINQYLDQIHSIILEYSYYHKI
ncbi:LA2681 family HEPN domain-containing protein [Methanobacterium formicicum]|uniref:LA2681 family HEPN domain-containing protein n=1 Tax=Methanobacterium formicicum TaxID=2162 RepID=UPI000AAF0357|nr:LA2681 family HEPN domain-containing protein [Methanobacterium formicicum]